MIRAALCCPVCHARFRGTARCSRCGADLAPLMRLAGRAHKLDLAARGALLDGDPAEALILALEACRIQATSRRRRMALLAAIVAGAYG